MEAVIQSGQKEFSVDSATFSQGLLLALREFTNEFVAEGDSFHKAYKATLLRAKEEMPNAPVDSMLRQYDAIFGVYHHANKMILEAEQDMILSLMNPQFKKASFKISPELADQELDEYDQKDSFKSLAKYFHEQLGDVG